MSLPIHKHEEIMAAAIDHMVLTGGRQSLPDLAAHFGMEATQFQKIFTQYVGVSPKKFELFMQYKTARELLLQGYSTLDAAYEAGLSGNARLHDLFIHVEAASPGIVKAKGKGVVMREGWHQTPLGLMHLAVTPLGLAWLGFIATADKTGSALRLRRHWPLAEIVTDQAVTKDYAEKIISFLKGERLERNAIPLHLYGTNFQLQVWQALLKIPEGYTVPYNAVAEFIGKPKASRAVGSAVGANPVSLLIPCHRVIQKSGVVENYGWGSRRKQALLGVEGQRAGG